MYLKFFACKQLALSFMYCTYTIMPSYNASLVLLLFLCIQDDGRVGDEFMKQIQPIATQIPYMVAPGNHEWLQ